MKRIDWRLEGKKENVRCFWLVNMKEGFIFKNSEGEELDRIEWKRRRRSKICDLKISHLIPKIGSIRLNSSLFLLFSFKLKGEQNGDILKVEIHFF